MSILSSFNTVSEEFFQKLIKTFPNEKKLSVYYANFKATKQFNPRIPMEYVMNPLTQYGYQILTKDENFFKSDNLVQAVESFSEKTGLVNMWDSMDADTKDSVWEYMQSIYVLGMRAMGLDEQLSEILELIKKSKPS